MAHRRSLAGVQSPIPEFSSTTTKTDCAASQAYLVYVVARRNRLSHHVADDGHVLMMLSCVGGCSICLAEPQNGQQTSKVFAAAARTSGNDTVMRETDAGNATSKKGQHSIAKS